MVNPQVIEQYYREFIADLPKCAHDGILQVDLKFLHENNLLLSLHSETGDPEDLSQYFHVVESPEKVTLFNDQFIVWIVPKTESENPSTLVLIALCQGEKPHLEVVFTTKGVYNTPRYVLKILQHFLVDMTETEATLMLFEKNS